MTGGWIEEARRYGPVQVAGELGLEVTRDGLRRCPACGSDRRGREDRRGPVRLYGRGLRWECFRCEAWGSGVDLVGLALQVEPTGPDVRAWFAARGWCTPGRRDSPRRGLRRPVVPPRPPAPPPPPKPRPEGVAAFWDSCELVTDHPEVAAYLKGRGIDPVIVEDLDLARVQTRSSSRPAWGYDPVHWPLVAPLFDASGTLASVKFRRVRELEGPKSRAPRGCDAKGLVFADLLGRLLLETGERPGWWPADEPLSVWVAEGEADLLYAAAEIGDSNATAPALLALGSWSDEIASRIPDGADVTIATDNDPNGAGDRMAVRIGVSLRERCTVRRHQPSPRASERAA